MLRRLIDELLTPNLEQLATILLNGDIPIAVFEPSPWWMSALAQHGWTGEAVFPMPEIVRRTKTDTVSDAWLARPFVDGGPARVFVAFRNRSLLLNSTPDEGWNIEPGWGEQRIHEPRRK